MASYKPDRRGMRELGMSAVVGDAMVAAAEKGRAWAEANAPRDSGEYAGSFEVARATVQAGWSNEDRAGAVLYNTAPHGGVVEWRDHVLSRAVNAIEGAP